MQAYTPVQTYHYIMKSSTTATWTSKEEFIHCKWKVYKNDDLHRYLQEYAYD